METFLTYFLIAIIIFIVYVYYEGKYSDVGYVKSNVDGQDYVVRNLPDKQAAADMIAEICIRIKKLIDHLENTFPNDEITRRISKRFKSSNVSEGAYDIKYTSYSINKGEKIVLCLRSRDKIEALEPLNILMCVVLHEVAHIGTESIGHTTEFWNTFKFILKESIGIGIYTHYDFENDPKSYCGTTITDTPYTPP